MTHPRSHSGQIQAKMRTRKFRRALNPTSRCITRQRRMCTKPRELHSRLAVAQRLPTQGRKGCWDKGRGPSSLVDRTLIIETNCKRKKKAESEGHDKQSSVSLLDREPCFTNEIKITWGFQSLCIMQLGYTSKTD